MARPSKLTTTQCETARSLHAADTKRWNATRLAKRFKVSESSMYNVLNGSYTARAVQSNNLPVVRPLRPNQPQPSIFQAGNPMPDIDLSNLGEVDELTLAAAHLIVSRSRFAAALRQH